MRTVHWVGDTMLVGSEEIELTWKELPARLEEAAVVRVLASAGTPEADTLWAYTSPIPPPPPKPEGHP